MLLLIWTITLILTLWLFLRQRYSRFSQHGVKGLKPWPVLGNMGKVAFRLEHMMDLNYKLFNSFPSERFCGYFDFLNPVVVIRDLDLIKKVAVKDFEYFLDHRAIIDEDSDNFFGRTVFTLRGQKWKSMRSTLSPVFTSSKMRLMVPFMEKAAKQMVDALKKKMESNTVDGIDLDCRDVLARYSSDVTASCTFGLQLNSHTEQNNDFFEMAQASSNFNFTQVLKFLGFAAFPRLMKMFKIQMFTKAARDFFRNLVTNTMDEREKNKIHRNDMIQLLMEIKKGKLCYEEASGTESEAGFATVNESEVGKKINRVDWSADDLIAQAALFFIAGTEISSFMTLMMFELALNIDVQDRLVREIKEYHEKHKEMLDYTSIQRLTYLDMVVSEVLRLWSPAFIDRQCLKNYNLGRPNADSIEDYIVYEGEGVVIPVWGIHHSPDFYPDPFKFDPERFSEKNKHKIHPFTFMPFGAGPRNCIASRFALCEMKVMAYWLLQSIEVTPCEKTRIPLTLSTESFNLRLKGGHWLRFKLRQD